MAYEIVQTQYMVENHPEFPKLPFTEINPELPNVVLLKLFNNSSSEYMVVQYDNTGVIENNNGTIKIRLQSSKYDARAYYVDPDSGTSGWIGFGEITGTYSYTLQNSSGEMATILWNTQDLTDSVSGEIIYPASLDKLVAVQTTIVIPDLPQETLEQYPYYIMLKFLENAVAICTDECVYAISTELDDGSTVYSGEFLDYSGNGIIYIYMDDLGWTEMETFTEQPLDGFPLEGITPQVECKILAANYDIYLANPDEEDNLIATNEIHFENSLKPKTPNLTFENSQLPEFPEELFADLENNPYMVVCLDNTDTPLWHVLLSSQPLHFLGVSESDINNNQLWTDCIPIEWTVPLEGGEYTKETLLGTQVNDLEFNLPVGSSLNPEITILHSNYDIKVTKINDSIPTVTSNIYYFNDLDKYNTIYLNNDALPDIREKLIDYPYVVIREVVGPEAFDNLYLLHASKAPFNMGKEFEIGNASPLDLLCSNSSETITYIFNPIAQKWYWADLLDFNLFGVFFFLMNEEDKSYSFDGNYQEIFDEFLATNVVWVNHDVALVKIIESKNGSAPDWIPAEGIAFPDSTSSNREYITLNDNNRVPAIPNIYYSSNAPYAAIIQKQEVDFNNMIITPVEGQYYLIMSPTPYVTANSEISGLDFNTTLPGDFNPEVVTVYSIELGENKAWSVEPILTDSPTDVTKVVAYGDYLRWANHDVYYMSSMDEDTGDYTLSDEIYYDSASEPPVAPPVTPPEEHIHEYTISEVIDPTCVNKGYTIYTCNCGDSYQDNEVAALGHDYQLFSTSNATCTTTGKKVYKCSRCNDSYEESIPALGHDYKLTQTIQPTCSNTGYSVYTCSRCGDSYNDNVIQKLEHNYEIKETIAPTCEANGYTTYKCSHCNEEKIDNETNALGHNYTSQVIEPTTESEGYTLHTCQNCGKQYKDNYVERLPVEEGNKQYICESWNWLGNLSSELRRLFLYTYGSLDPNIAESGLLMSMPVNKDRIELLLYLVQPSEASIIDGSCSGINITYNNAINLEKTPSLTIVDLNESNEIDVALLNNKPIHTLILRSNTVCKVNNINNSDENSHPLYGTSIETGEGFIYIPAALLDSYKTDTTNKWNMYTDNFRDIESYPEICGY